MDDYVYLQFKLSCIFEFQNEITISTMEIQTENV